MTNEDHPKLGAELRTLVSLAFPLVLSQLGLTLMGTVDVALLGHYSEPALAGGGIGFEVVYSLTTVGVGLMLALDAVIPTSVGANQMAAARNQFWNGVWLACLVGVVMGIVALLVPLILPRFLSDPEVLSETGAYLSGRALGLLPAFVFTAQRSYIQALGPARVFITVTIIGNVVNFLADYVLIFVGLGLPTVGIPSLGAAGAAWSTTVVSAVSMLYLAWWSRTKLSSDGSRRWDGQQVRLIIRKGLPLVGMLAADHFIMLFLIISAGWIGTAEAATVAVAITLYAISYQAFAGWGSAAAVRVGWAIGARRKVPAWYAARVATFATVTIAIFVGLIYASFGGNLVQLLTESPAVREVAGPLLIVFAFFQAADGMQIVLAGVLRGAGDTDSPLWSSLAGSYLVGLPSAAWLGFGMDHGVVGICAGLALGMTVSASVLSWRFVRLLRPHANTVSSVVGGS